MTGVKESDTGLAAPNLWDIPADKQRMQEEQPLQVKYMDGISIDSWLFLHGWKNVGCAMHKDHPRRR
jgi:hypothetical protein